jgi:hypothetical protein
MALRKDNAVAALALRATAIATAGAAAAALIGLLGVTPAGAAPELAVIEGNVSSWKPSDSASPKPSDHVSPSPSVSKSESPTPPPATTGPAPTATTTILPVTGTLSTSTVTGIVLAGVAMTAGGATLVFLRRRRATSAE